MLEPEHIDHGHRTGPVRGVLRGPCTMGPGQLRERVDVLEAAIDYLGGPRWRTYLEAPGVYQLLSSPPA